MADDWPVLLRARDAAPPEAWLRAFARLDGGWYRPLSDLYFAVAWRSAALQAAGYRIAGVAIFVLTTALVMLLARTIARRRRAGIVAGAIFATLAVHAEAVLWIAAANELLAGLAATCAMVAAVRFGNTGARRWLGATWLAFAVGIAAKETVIGLPLALWAGAFCAHASRHGGVQQHARHASAERLRRAATASLAPALIAAASAAAHLVRGLPYDVSLAPTALLRNLIYSVAMLFAAVPPSRADLVGGDATGAAWIPWSVVAVAALALLALAIAGRTALGDAPEHPHAALLHVGVALVIAGLLPGLPIVTDRTTYVASIGAALVVAALATSGMRRRRDRRRRFVAALACAALLVAHATSLEHRASHWREAARLNDRVARQIEQQARATPGVSEIWMIGLPDRLRYAYAFRNAYPAAGVLLELDVPVRAVLDIDVDRSMPEVTRRAIVLRFEGGRLSPQAMAPP